MENQELISQIVRDIKESKKYRSVYDKTIERIVGDFVSQQKSKSQTIDGRLYLEIKKKTKNLLHQIWGAFYASRPDFERVIGQLQKNVQTGKSVKESVLPILNLQSSVKERIPILDEFYKKIFEITGMPNSIIDYACGLNPLTLPWMALPKTSKYRAFDIDQQEVDFLNSAFTLLDVKNVEVRIGDVLSDELESADVVFLLKLLPCLEHQKKNSALELLKALACKYIVVSFPVKSISGKKAGMGDFYSNNFKNMIEKESWKITEILFETELVFVIKKT